MRGSTFIFSVKKLAPLLILFLLLTFSLQAQEDKEVIKLWPEDVPGQTEPKAEPEISDNRSGNVTRIAKVTDPALIVYEASGANKKDAAVIIAPGGGYHILAINHEGYEIAEWFNSLGVTAFVLQYRVPQQRDGALQDIQRAFRVVRSKADQYGINTEKIGVLGFSAGGSLAARASNLFTKNTYFPASPVDYLSSRPNFAMLIYAAYLDEGPGGTLTPELEMHEKTPPTFLFVTADDKHGSDALVYAGELRNKDIPLELHMYQTGGHGYGMRENNPAGKAWPPLAEAWLMRILEK